MKPKLIRLSQNNVFKRPNLQAFLVLIILTSACSPRDERPGFWLQGNEATGVINDWHFTDDIEEILIETTTWYLLAHSTTIWCVQYEGNLYIGSYGPEKKFWENNIARNPQAKVKINNAIYQVVVSLLEDETLAQEINAAYNQKYNMEEVFADDIPKWWFYRVQQKV